MLAGVLNTSKTAVIAQAISRWVFQASRLREPKWTWHVEHQFQESSERRGKRPAGTAKMYARLPDQIIRQVEAFAETLHVPLSAVVEQALLRWCREDPLVQRSATKSNGSSNGQHVEET